MGVTGKDLGALGECGHAHPLPFSFVWTVALAEQRSSI
jgi:hypothetical protein